ncbi:MAG: hypothetical protein U5K76_11740 [Woeseiaceae bacterium]|nr:hypothetical protein [Woeseiaceae bacterium]
MQITLADISAYLKIPTLALSPVISELENNGLLLTTEQEQLMPGRDLARTAARSPRCRSLRRRDGFAP